MLKLLKRIHWQDLMKFLVKYSELERQASTDLNSLIMLQIKREFAKIDNAQKRRTMEINY